jgi:hypothetical protein
MREEARSERTHSTSCFGKVLSEVEEVQQLAEGRGCSRIHGRARFQFFEYRIEELLQTRVASDVIGVGQCESHLTSSIIEKQRRRSKSE